MAAETSDLQANSTPSSPLYKIWLVHSFQETQMMGSGGHARVQNSRQVTDTHLFVGRQGMGAGREKRLPGIC